MRKVFFIFLILLPLLASCASRPVNTTADVRAEYQKKQQINAINQSIESMAVASTAESGGGAAEMTRDSYTLGSGDVLDIAVFQVDELNRTVRVTGDGYIMIPLLGAVRVQGMTTAELEEKLSQELGAQYLQDPHVSVFVSEFRSHQVAVLGAVEKPSVYQIQQPRTVLEMLAEAGGLTKEAGTKVYVRRTVSDPKSEQKSQESLVIDLKELLKNPELNSSLVMHGGDSINVPEGGVVFVEGAVKNPGSYQMPGEVTVLKAVSMAGGFLFEASEGNVQVFRETDKGQEVLDVDIDAVRDQKAQDVILEDGDIVVVRDNALKKGWAGFWRGFTGIFSVGARI